MGQSKKPGPHKTNGGGSATPQMPANGNKGAGTTSKKANSASTAGATDKSTQSAGGCCLSEKEQDELLAKIDKTIQDYPGQASENLRYWKYKLSDGIDFQFDDKKRSLRPTRYMPESYFTEPQMFKLITDALSRTAPRSARQKFEEGAVRRLRTKEIIPGQGFQMHWPIVVKGNPELLDQFAALGDFTVRSEVDATVLQRSDGKYVLHFNNWKFRVEDLYDWDPNKNIKLFGIDTGQSAGIPIPGAGYLTGKEMWCLEQAGHGQSYLIHTRKPIVVTDPVVTGDIVLPYP